MDRPTVPEAVNALRAYHALPGRENGGAVHIVTEDGNVAQHFADWCVENAPKWGTEWGDGGFIEDDLRIAEMLAAMSATQRSKLYAEGSFYPE